MAVSTPTKSQLNAPGQLNASQSGAELLLAETHPFARLKQLFRNADNVTEEAIRSVYATDIEFRDPVNVILGVSALEQHTLALYRNLEFCEFDYQQELISENSASVVWDMRVRHPRLNKGKTIVLRGQSYLEWQEKITYHEDFFDLGAMLYEHVPLLGRVLKVFKSRMKARH